MYPKYFKMLCSNMIVSKHMDENLAIKSLLYKKELELDSTKHLVGFWELLAMHNQYNRLEAQNIILASSIQGSNKFLGLTSRFVNDEIIC